MGDEVDKVKRAAAATISKLTEEKSVLTEQLRVMQRAVSESQRVAAEASEEVEKLRGELESEKKATSAVEERAGDKLAALERAAKAEREKAAAVELSHHTAQAAAAQAAAGREKALQEEVAAVRSELAVEKERVSELQRSVEHLTRAGEEARELWARLKQALLVRACLVGALFCPWGLSRKLPAPVSLAPPLPPRRRRRCVTHRWAQSRP
jgi:DNA repair exonuclease SbcCD ATPase subunit